MVATFSGRLPRLAWWLAAPLLMSGIATSARAQQREIDVIQGDIAATGVKLKTLVDKYSNIDLSEQRQDFAERLTDAEILFLLQDYPRASLILFDLVDDPRYKNEKLHVKALYYLAESQFQMGNDIAARQRFEKLVERRRTEHLTAAIRRLIELADRTREWGGLDKQVSILRTKGKLPPSIAYIHTKSLLRQGKYAAVDAAAADIPADHAISPKARYMVAVAKLLRGNLEEAREIFVELSKIEDRFDDASEIRDLARMSNARIRVEQHKLVAAVDAYQDIKRSSSFFEGSLYEIAWLYVRAADAADGSEARAKEFARALRALEILLLSETSTTLAPEARILLGNILLRLDRFEEATVAFHEIVERYEPVRVDLEKLVGEVTDPGEYYEEIVERNKSGGGLLPPLAIKWAAEQRDLQVALGVVNDIDQGETWIEESRRIIDKLLTILNSEKKAQFFPALHEAQATLLGIENNLISLSFRLLSVERRVVEGELDPERAEALDKVLTERARLEPEYRKLPQKKEEYEGRLSDMKQRMAAIQKKAFRLKWEVEEMRRTIDGLKIWLVEHPGALPEDDEQELRTRLGQADAEVKELESHQAALEQEVAKERSLITLSTDEEVREDEVRARYSATLEEERRILAVGGTAVVGPEKKGLGTIADQREVLARYHAQLEQFKTALGELVGEQSLSIRSKLLAEQGRLESHATAIGQARNEAKRVVGEIAIDSLRDVEQTFENIVLRGDVGIIDVAWALKEEKTQQINSRVGNQRRDLKSLDSEFQSLGAKD